MRGTGKRWVLRVLPLLGLLAACNDFSTLGDDVTSAVDIVSDTVQIVGMANETDTTFYTDVFGLDRASNAGSNFQLLNNHLLGVLNDPVLGRFDARTILQFTSTTFDPPDLGFDVRLDSIVLVLNTTARYGDATIPQTLEVRELADTLRFPFSLEPVFRFDTTVATRPGVLASQTYSRIDTAASRDIRIRMPLSLAQRIFADLRLLASNEVQTVLDFKSEVLRGLEIRSTGVSNGNLGALYVINASSSSTRLQIFYRSRQSSTSTLLSQSFVLTPSYLAQRYTRVERDGTGTLVDSIATPAINNGSRVYLQGTTPEVVRIRLRDLQTELPDALISSAVLTVSVDPQSLRPLPGNTFVPPYQLPTPINVDLYLASSEDTTQLDPDLLVSRGTFNTTTQSYQFDIRAALQFMLGDPSREVPLILAIPSRQQSAQRVVLATHLHPNPQLRPQLRVIYSPQPE